jgi:SAM-dependent methyltransferase
MRSLRTTSRLAARRLARKVLAATRDEPPLARQACTRKRGPSTVAEGWDRYARRRRTEPRIGDDWNNPRIMGLDVEDRADVVGHLDRVVFEPFLGEPDVIVEIGPGGGRFTEVLLPKCRVLHAVDTSSHMIDSLRARFGEDRSVVYHVADGTGLGMLSDGSADAAFSYGVFVHLQHWDIFNYLTELERVLRPGGKAIIQHANTFSELGGSGSGPRFLVSSTVTSCIGPSRSTRRSSWPSSFVVPGSSPSRLSRTSPSATASP